MAADKYDGMQDRWPVSHLPGDQARLAVAVTPDDNKDLQNSSGALSYAKALYIGASGDVQVICAGDKSNAGAGTAVIFKSHPVGYMPVQVRRVMNALTTASSIVALMD